MESNTDVVSYFMTQGPWAVLFVILLWKVLKENGKREDRLITVVEKFEDRFEHLDDKVEKIDGKVEHIETKIDELVRREL